MISLSGSLKVDYLKPISKTNHLLPFQSPWLSQDFSQMPFKVHHILRRKTWKSQYLDTVFLEVAKTQQDSRKCLLSFLTQQPNSNGSFLFVDGCHCGYITNLRGKNSCSLLRQSNVTVLWSNRFCIARLLPLQSSPQLHQKKTISLIDSVLNLIVCDREHGHATCLHIKG